MTNLLQRLELLEERFLGWPYNTSTWAPSSLDEDEAFDRLEMELREVIKEIHELTKGEEKTKLYDFLEIFQEKIRVKYEELQLLLRQQEEEGLEIHQYNQASKTYNTLK